MIYLDNAATSRFKSEETLKACYNALKNSANPGRSSHSGAIGAALTVYRTREKVGSFFKCDGAHTVFTKNCTEALNLAILGTVPENAHIITTVAEHNSVLRPLYRLARDRKIRISVLPLTKDGHVPVYKIANAITIDTYMVIVNHVSNVNGVTANIAEIGKLTANKNIRFLVDASQSAGHIPINMHECNIDMLACPAHKGLLGVQGLGFLIFTERAVPSPLIYGGTGTNSESVYHPKDAPEAYEAGTLNYPAICALSASLDYLASEQEHIENSVAHMTNELLYGLGQIKNVKLYTPRTALTGVVSFNIGEMPSSTVGDILNEKYDIAVRSGLHCAPLMHNFLGTLEQGTVRASIGAGNTMREINKLLSSIERTAKGI